MSKAILLADDSVTIQKVIELTFMDQDYQIEAVSSGDEALRRLDGGVPDLVIADVHMPGASGFDVARRSKELSPETPVLVLVGTFEPFDEADFDASGADEVLKKPFDSQELLRLVGKLLPEGGDEASAEDAVQAPSEEPVPPAAEDEGEETGVFYLDDGAFDGSSEVLPPPDLAPSDASPLAGLAWNEPEPSSSEDASEAEGLLEPAFDQPPPEAEAVSASEPEEAKDWEPAEEAEEAEAEELEAQASDEVSQEADETYFEDAPESPEAGGGEPFPSGILSDDDIERIAERVAQRVGEKLVRDIAWDVIPDLAEVIIKQRIEELESQVE